MEDLFNIAGDGDGVSVCGGGGIWDHFRRILKPFKDPQCSTNIFVQPEVIFLEMAHNHFVSSIE